MNVFFDLDGTLIDSKPRLYHLFQHLVPQSEFSFDEYWKLKQNKMDHKEILTLYFKYHEDDISKFTSEWMSLIETSKWLSYDKTFDGIRSFLDLLKPNNNLFVVTARQYELVAIDQIEELGISDVFKDILVTNQTTSKEDLIKKCTVLTNEDWVIGDTGKDIETGKNLGMKTAAVLSGFLSEKQLVKYSPDIIVENVTLLNL